MPIALCSIRLKSILIASDNGGEIVACLYVEFNSHSPSVFIVFKLTTPQQ